MHKMDVKELLQPRKSTAEENQKLIQNSILPFGTKKREKRGLRSYRPFSQAIHCKNSNHADGDQESASQSTVDGVLSSSCVVLLYADKGDK